MKNGFKEKFKVAYQKLNAEQKRGVDAIEGPVMVIAGPGTGKTHLLTMRVANILDKTDTPPEAILALTFTDSAVVSMRRQLSEIIGSLAYRVTVATFHSFANDIIKNYPDYFPEIMDATNISDIDQVKIVRKIIDKGGLKKLKTFGSPYFYLAEIIKSIGELKRQGVSPEEFLKIVQKEKEQFSAIKDMYHTAGLHKGKMKGRYIELKKDIDRNKELFSIYKDYQLALRKMRFYDYDDMIMQVMLAFKKNKDLLLIAQEKYLYVLVDEHQDTNSAQNKILELMSNYHKNPNLFIVGDEKQAIFRFQGASLENFLYFKSLYKNVALVELQDNYRSSQSILDAAHGLNPKTNKLVSQSRHLETPIKCYAFAAPEAEQYFLSKDVKRLIGEGKPADQIAVLYRENRDVLPLARIFEKSGVPFVIESDQDIFEDHDIRKLLIILKAVQKFGQEADLVAFLHVDIFGIGPLDIYKLINLQKAYKKRGKYISLYDIIKNVEGMEQEGIEDAQKLKNLYNKLSLWKKAAHNKNSIEAFEDIVRDSGVLAYMVSMSLGSQKIAKVHALFDQIKSLVKNHKNYTLEDFFEYLDLLQEHNVPIKTAALGQALGRVRLMTAHKSKGLEFDYVYIVNANDGHWGSRRRHEHITLPKGIYSLLKKVDEAFETENDDDERNLFYVALTRAKKELSITYSKRSQDGKDQLPAKFMQEIKTGFFENIEAGEHEVNNHGKNIEFMPSIIVSSTAKEKEFLSQLFLERGISVTALNNYISCPWKYFYRNLLRIPESPNKHLMFGSAMHHSLKNYFDKFLQEGQKPKKEYLLQRFSEALAQYPIQDKEYREALDKGKTALSGYYDTYHDAWKANVLTEFNINGIKINSTTTINGRIDKMEMLDNLNNVKVVDYKTGKQKSRNEIEGKNKNSGGEYKRQLVFYNLLLNNYQGGKFKMAQGEVDFLEPDEKGRYRKELFFITPKEVEDLEEQITSVAKEIISLKFWNATCDDKDCYYCKLRKTMKQ